MFNAILSLFSCVRIDSKWNFFIKTDFFLNKQKITILQKKNNKNSSALISDNNFRPCALHFYSFFSGKKFLHNKKIKYLINRVVFSFFLDNNLKRTNFERFVLSERRKKSNINFHFETCATQETKHKNCNKISVILCCCWFFSYILMLHCLKYGKVNWLLWRVGLCKSHIQKKMNNNKVQSCVIFNLL